MSSTTQDSHRRVFVVHGRDLAVRQAMYEFLRAVGLQPIEWNQAIRLAGRTSPYIGEILDAAFAHAQAVVVLFTPDDEARLRRHFVQPSDPVFETDATPQPRQNVLFEAGMAMGRSEERTVLVQVGDVRPFSDVGGRYILRMDNSTPKRQELAERLTAAGCSVDLSGTDWHSAGNFVVTDEPLEPSSYEAPRVEPEEELVSEIGSEEAGDEEPGFLELLAEMEEAAPAFNATMEDLAADLEQIGETARRGTAEIEASDARGGGSRGRLAAAIRFAQTLEPVAARTEQFIDDQRVRARSIEGGVGWLFERIRSGELTDEEREAAGEMLPALATAGEAAHGAIESTRTFINSFTPVGQTARPVRRVVTRLVTAYESLITTLERWVEWGDTAEELLGGL